jgi:tRNA wybutosine-synthesizing protein 4
MANVYAQVAGVRKMILFPPGDVKYLSFAPGASSSSIDVFQALEASATSLHTTHPQEAVIHPGDILLLPALWLHTAAPMTDMSIAVNVFFRDLEQEEHYAPGRDVYGNKDLEVYEKGRQAVTRIAKSLRPLPPAAREFYLSRIADELRLATEA